MADRVLLVLDDPCRLDGAATGTTVGAAVSTTGGRAREVAPDRPVVSATDLGVTRGDGIFEVLGVRADASGGVQVHAERPHLDRLARSARMLGMPAPDTDAFADAIRAAATSLGLARGEDGAVKVVLTRGPEDDADESPRPTGWVYAWRLGDQSTLRREGITVATMSRGYGRGLAHEAPWLLIGAKTLAYAVNRAAVREAQRRGAEEALFVTTDGYVLEGPTWTFAARIDGVVVSVPHDSGVLPGTTQAAAFDWLDAAGVPTAVRDIPVTELARADAAWLLSSTRLAVPIKEIDGRPVPIDAELTAGLNESLAAREH